MRSDDDQTALGEATNEDDELSEAEREAMVTVEHEWPSGHQLLARPWTVDTYWQVVVPGDGGPRRVGSPNGGCLFARDDERRARLYGSVRSRCTVETDDVKGRIPANIAAAGPGAVVAYLHAYRKYDVTTIASQTQLSEAEAETLLDEWEAGEDKCGSTTPAPLLTTCGKHGRTRRRTRTGSGGRRRR